MDDELLSLSLGRNSTISYHPSPMKLIISTNFGVTQEQRDGADALYTQCCEDDIHASLPFDRRGPGHLLRFEEVENGTDTCGFPSGHAELTGIGERPPDEIVAKTVGGLRYCLSEGNQGHVRIAWEDEQGRQNKVTEVDFRIYAGYCKIDSAIGCELETLKRSDLAWADKNEFRRHVRRVLEERVRKMNKHQDETGAIAMMFPHLAAQMSKSE